MEVSIKILTPIWTGGVEAGKCDRIHETGILGSLRWWMEALVRGMGGQVKDPTTEERSVLDPDKFDINNYRKLHKEIEQAKDEEERLKNEIKLRQYLREAGLCDVSQIFGATGWKHRFRITVSEAKLDWQPSVPLKITPSDRTRGWFLNPGWLGTLQINLHGDAETLVKLHALLRFIEAWGSLGARPQLGYGAFRITEIKDPPDIKTLSHQQAPLFFYQDDNRQSTNIGEFPDLRSFTFFKLRFTPKTAIWWHTVPGIKELRTRRDSWMELEQLAKRGIVPTTPALKNYLRFHHKWSSPDLPHWLFGTIRSDERLRSKVAFSWAYRLDNSAQWEMRGWMYLPQDKDGRRFKDEVLNVFKDRFGQPQNWLTALGLDATDYRTAILTIEPTENPWQIHRISEVQAFLQTALTGAQS